MPEPSASPTPDKAQVESQLRQLSQRLRTAAHLDPQSQRALADLMEQLAHALAAAPLASTEATQLAASTAQLGRALEQKQDRGHIATAMRLLEEAALRAEAETPIITGFARRMLEILANLGI
jgi:hypothetical protein